MRDISNYSSISNSSLVNTGAVYFLASSVLNSAYSVVKVSTNIINPFIAGVLDGMTYDKIHKADNITEALRIQQNTTSIISNMVEKIKNSSSKLFDEIKYTYNKAYNDIQNRDKQLKDIKDLPRLIVDRRDPSVSGYIQRSIRQSILKQDPKTFGGRVLQVSNYLDVGIKSTIVLTQRAYYNLGFIIGSAIGNSLESINLGFDKQHLFYASSALYSVNLMIQAVLMPLHISVNLMYFVINAAMMGLTGFIIGREYDLAQNDLQATSHIPDNDPQEITSNRKNHNIVTNVITTIAEAAPQTKKVIDELYGTYHEYYKYTRERDQTLHLESVDKFVRERPLQNHNMLSLELRKSSLEHQNPSNIQKAMNHINAANNAISMCLTKYAFELGSSVRNMVQHRNHDKSITIQPSIG